MLRYLSFTCAILALASPALANNATRPLPGDMPSAFQTTDVVNTTSGPVEGLDDGQMLGWLGIPYAAPPIGELRWMPPEPHAPWQSARAADAIGEACVQGADLGLFATPGGAEDCLTLNVYGDRQAINRAEATGERLPVIVWIHGGALHVGQGADYDPRALVADGKAIVVTINYRLGVFGFFSHPAIDAEGHPAINYGQMDQTFALRWVHDNIASFGGDPENVTISGESSGGTSVVAQILTPWAEGLFQNAVTFSGGAMMLKSPNFGSVSTQEEAQAVGEGFASVTGCAADDAATCLRNLDAAAIVSQQRGYQLAQTVIDGDCLPDWPEALFRDGAFNRVNIVSGTTLDEGDFFMALPELATGVPLASEAYQGALEAQYGAKLAPLVAQEYPLSHYLNASKAVSATVTDYLFACPSVRLMDLASAHTQVRGFEFADRTAPSYTPPLSFEIGAAHTFELPFLFPGFHGGAAGLPTELNPQQRELAEDFRGWFTSMSESGGWSEWPRYDATSRAVRQVQIGNDRMLQDGAYASNHHCAFWDERGVY